MYRPTQTRSSRLHRVASFTLAVWLGGVFCLFCCGRGVASVSEVTTPAATTAAESAPTEACASHACCHKKAESDGAPRESLAAVSTAGGRCCAAPGQAVVLPIKKKFLEPDTAKQATWLPVASRDWASNPVGVRQSFYTDRRETYLRCCVFLI